jgi:hypothetical protein
MSRLTVWLRHIRAGSSRSRTRDRLAAGIERRHAHSARLRPTQGDTLIRHPNRSTACFRTTEGTMRNCTPLAFLS